MRHCLDLPPPDIFLFSFSENQIINLDVIKRVNSSTLLSGDKHLAIRFLECPKTIKISYVNKDICVGSGIRLFFFV